MRVLTGVSVQFLIFFQLLPPKLLATKNKQK